MNLNGKVVIITGAAAGIGAATAKLFARRGASLTLLDIDEEGLRKVETECRSAGAGVLALTCDTSLLPELDRATLLLGIGQVDVGDGGGFSQAIALE